MVKNIKIESGWPCKLRDCPVGLFLFEDCLGFKSEYDGGQDVYVVDSGEFFWGGTTKIADRDELVVFPLNAKLEFIIGYGK